MLVEYLRYGELHHWAVFCCTIATLGLVGAFWVALFATTGKGVFAFLNGSRQPTVIVVNQGGQYVQQPQKKRWGFGRCWLLFAAIFSGGPMLTLLLIAANQAASSGIHWLGARWWLAPIVGALVLTALILIGYWRSDARRSNVVNAISPTPLNDAHLGDLPYPPVVAAQPMWSLADYDEREFEH